MLLSEATRSVIVSNKVTRVDNTTSAEGELEKLPPFLLMAGLCFDLDWVIPSLKCKPERRCSKLWEHLVSTASRDSEDSVEVVSVALFWFDLRP